MPFFCELDADEGFKIRASSGCSALRGSHIVLKAFKTVACKGLSVFSYYQLAGGLKLKTNFFEIINTINTKKFSKKMRGFDPVEVSVFMRKMARNFEKSFEGHQDMTKRLKQVEVELQEYKEREDLLRKTLANATEMSTRIKEDSSREAKLIISDAHHKAEMITRDAKDSLRRIYQDISELRRVRLQFENNLKAILNSHITMLEQGQRTIPDPVVDDQKLKQDLKDLEAEVTNLPEDDFANQEAPSLDL
ncbi:MAG: DivIVA domain-containing protein [Bdellovibrionales bacterium]